MADYLAIDWEPHQLSVVELDAGKSRLKVRKAHQFEWPETLGRNATASEIGDWLKSELASAKISTKQVLLCMPREFAVLRQLDLPKVPFDELPDLVRLQAATKSTVSLDQVVLDFVPLPETMDEDAVHVLMATLPKDRLTKITSAMASAGLTVASVGVSSMAAAELVDRIEKHRKLAAVDLSVIIAQHGERVEITMLHDGKVILSQPTQVDGIDAADDARGVVGEINRLVVPLQRMLPNVSVSRAWVFQDEGQEALVEALKNRFSCEVHDIDPLELGFVSGDMSSLSGGHAAFAGPLGLTLSREESVVPQLDFINPRKRVEVQDNTRTKVLAGVGCAVVLLAGGYSWFLGKIGDLEDEIASARSQTQTLNQENLDAEESLDSADSIRKWKQTDFDWLAAIGSVNETMTEVNAESEEGEVTSDSHRVYLSEMHFEGGLLNALGHLRATGFARTGGDVDELKQELRAGELDVYPSQTKWSRKDAAYLREFPLEFDMAPREPETNTRSRRTRSSSRGR